MPVANVIRVSHLGTMPSGEVWSVNPVWQIGGVSTAEEVTSEMAQTMATAIAAITIPTALVSMLTSSCAHSGVRVEARRWDGTLATQAEAVRAVPVVGTGTGNHPFQTSIVSSLLTSGVGGSGRGRLYWPATGTAVVTGTLRPSSSTVSSILSGVKTYLTSVTTALNATLFNDAVLSVWSRTNAATLPVNSLRMGDVLDTQRRRRDALLEGYASLSFP